MLVGEVQAQHWMEIAEWENPERPLGLQPGDYPTDLLYNRDWEITDSRFGQSGKSACSQPR